MKVAKKIIISADAKSAFIVRYHFSGVKTKFYNLRDKNARRLFDAVYPLTVHKLPNGGTYYFSDNRRVK